ncbi:hypothetical protein RND15_09860 [Streptomyces sp. DSM 41529]|uniref:Uncharacterized protein n=1 Tax=Streptomyces lonegramiae TaxID=3075524 RepID=A0ABU2XD22_9ACTN|nr:hypothetical protein [Streptomyces sp. DSM 41529]MDT0543025.1 hypothetical protein [Streptomyces sp. DSM 41529]
MIPVFVPYAYQQQALRQHFRREAAAAGDGGDRVQAAGAQHRFLQHVDERHDAPTPLYLGLDSAQVARLGLGLGRREPDRPGLPLGDVQPGQLRHFVVEQGQLGRHLLAQLVDEHRGVQGLAQLPVVLRPPGLEVLGQVLIGVAPLVGADHPDLLALELIAQGLEGHDLVDHAHHPASAALVGAVHDFRPVPAHRLVDRHRLAQRVVRRVPRVRVPRHQRQGLDHGPVGMVGGTELQHVQQLDQPAPVVVGVRRLQRRLHRAPVDRAAGLELVHQLPQRRLAPGHRREHDLADRPLRGAERRLGELEEDVLLARYLLERVDELLGDLLLRPRPDPVHGRDQQLHQRVGDLPLPLVQQSGQQGHPQRYRVRPQVGRRLDRGPCLPAGYDLRRDVDEQIPWQADRPHRQELVDLGKHRLQAHVARRFLDLPQHRRRVHALRAATVGSGVVVLVGAAGHQSHDPLHVLRGQPRGDPGRQRLLGRPQGSRDDPVAPARRGRLNVLSTATRQQFHPYLLGPAFLERDVLGQIRRQLLRVRDAALTEAEMAPDLRAVVLDRTARPVVGLQLRGGNLRLPGDELHGLTGQLCPVPGKPAVLRVELQQHSEAQSRHTALAGHERLLVLQQRPVLDQLVQVQRSTGHDR